MEPISAENVKKLQLDILDFVTRFCNDNDIKYWITDGTLLGAVRHKGFIPWDDDIDIGMLRNDYDKFTIEFKETDRYLFKTVEIDNRYPFQMGKILDKNTVLYEPDQKTGHKLAVNIDVFVYDNAPSDFDKTMEMYDKRDSLKRWRTLQRSKKHRGNALRRGAVTAFGRIIRFIPSSFFARQIVKNSKRYAGDETGYVGDFTGDYRIHIPKSIFDEMTNLEFEGRLLKAPSDYDFFLSEIYGKYWELPPANKRISTHSFEAFTK